MFKGGYEVILLLRTSLGIKKLTKVDEIYDFWIKLMNECIAHHPVSTFLLLTDNLANSILASECSYLYIFLHLLLLKLYF